MITFFLTLGLIIFIIITIATCLIIGIQANKLRTYESWILEFKGNVHTTLEQLREIDTKGTFASSMNAKGTFESDDEVGVIFKNMESIIEELDQRTQ
jgi:hypothetical protein